MGPVDVLGGTQAGVLSEDLRMAALAALAIDREQCLDLARSYDWHGSVVQFRDALQETLVIRQTDRAEPRQASGPGLHGQDSFLNWPRSI